VVVCEEEIELASKKEKHIGEIKKADTLTKKEEPLGKSQEKTRQSPCFFNYGSGHFGKHCKAALVASRTRFLLDVSPDCR